MTLVGKSRWSRRFHVALWVLAAILACVPGCGGGAGPVNVNSPSETPPVASFSSSGTTAGPDRVRLTAEPGSGDLITIHVVVGGPTTSTDLYSFAFDLVLENPDAARYVNGTAVFGTALQPSAGQGESVMASQQGDRVVVGVTKTGGGDGNGINAGEPALVSLTFRVIDVGTCGLTIQGPPGAPSAPEALDPSGAPIGSIHFDTGQATLIGS